VRETYLIWRQGNSHRRKVVARIVCPLRKVYAVISIVVSGNEMIRRSEHVEAPSCLRQQSRTEDGPWKTRGTNDDLI